MTTAPDVPAIAVGGMLALLERRRGMDIDHFTRYWRDVHGVLATRIPGLHMYVQHHLAPEPAGVAGGTGHPVRLDGIAEVVLADRRALEPNPVSDHIRADEQFVFSSAVNFSLPGASVAGWGAWERTPSAYVVVRGRGGTPGATEPVDGLLAELASSGTCDVAVDCDLSAASSDWWATPGVVNDTGDETYLRALRLVARPAALRDDWLAELVTFVEDVQVPDGVSISVHDVRASYVMVDAGRPTGVGLRGLSAQSTIDEAAAGHQDTDAVRSVLFTGA